MPIILGVSLRLSIFGQLQIKVPICPPGKVEGGSSFSEDAITVLEIVKYKALPDSVKFLGTEIRGDETRKFESDPIIVDNLVPSKAGGDCKDLYKVEEVQNRQVKVFIMGVRIFV